MKTWSPSLTAFQNSLVFFPDFMIDYSQRYVCYYSVNKSKIIQIQKQDHIKGTDISFMN